MVLRLGRGSGIVKVWRGLIKVAETSNLCSVETQMLNASLHLDLHFGVRGGSD